MGTEVVSGDLSIAQPSAIARAAITGVHPIGGMPKRAMDVSVAAIALLVFAPIFLLVALAVWGYDRRNPFFGHTRIGHGGRTFRCLKFRSMVPDGAGVLARHLAEDEAAAREWRETRKLRRDPRVTPIGRALRTSSLDELPQLINVLRGEMSLVGPRPIVADAAPRYGHHIATYAACRPGLTGLWQVSGRSDTSYQARVDYDVDYASRHSLLRDLAIMLRTVPVVVVRRGSC